MAKIIRRKVIKSGSSGRWSKVILIVAVAVAFIAVVALSDAAGNARSRARHHDEALDEVAQLKVELADCDRIAEGHPSPKLLEFEKLKTDRISELIKEYDLTDSEVSKRTAERNAWPR